MLTSIVDYSRGLVLAVREGRSPRWPSVRRKHLKQHPTCAACGRSDFLEVHHKTPYHVDKSRELDPENLITLCENDPMGCDDHFRVGHNCDWKAFNLQVDADANFLLNQRMKNATV